MTGPPPSLTPLLRALDGMAEIQRAISATLTRTDQARKAELVALRRQFGVQLATVAAAIAADARLRADPALAAEFRNRFSRMRARIAEHQARFPAVMLDDVDDQYRTSAAAVVEGNRAFIEWARDVLRQQEQRGRT